MQRNDVLFEIILPFDSRYCASETPCLVLAVISDKGRVEYISGNLVRDREIECHGETITRLFADFPNIQRSTQECVRRILDAVMAYQDERCE